MMHLLKNIIALHIIFPIFPLFLLFPFQAAGQTITVSGTVYTDEGITPMADQTTLRVRLKANGVGDVSYSDSLESGDGTYSITNVSATSGTVLTVFLESTPLDFFVEKGTTVVLSDGSDINDLDIYQDHVIARSDNGSNFTIANLDQYDFLNNMNIYFTADTSGSPSLLDVAGTFYIWPGTTFYPVVLDTCTITLDDIKILGTYEYSWTTPTTYVSGSWINKGTFSTWPSRVTFDGTSGIKYIESGGDPFAFINFNDGKLGAGGGATWILSDDLDVQNDLTIVSGTLDTNAAGDYAITVEGDWSNTGGTFLAQNGLVTFDDDTPNSRTITTGGDAFYNLTFSASNPSTPTQLSTYALLDTLEVDNDLAISSGILFSNNKNILVEGSWANSGTFIAGAGFVSFDDDQSATHTITSGSSAFSGLTIDSTGGSSYLLEDPLEVVSYLWLKEGTLDTNSGEDNSINIGGLWVTNNGTLLANKGIVTFDNSQATTGGIYSQGISFYDLTINGNPGAVYLLEESLDVENDLTITAGILDTNVAESNTITIGGNWTNSDTFRAQNGLVTFDGAAPQTVTTGGSDWNDIEVTNPSTVTFFDKFTASNFTCEIPGAQLNFKYKATDEKFEITNHLSLQGDSDDDLYLRRFGGSGAERWELDPSGGSWTVEYIDVSDSINSYDTFINPSNSQDTGSNNFNWFSQEACITQITPASPSIDSEGSLQFSGLNAGDCSQAPAYNWSVTSAIGSNINASGLYTAGTNNTGNPVEEDVDVTDTANSVSDTITVCVGKDGCSVAVSPSSQSVSSGGTIQFTAANTGCTQGSLTWELTSSIGSSINSSGLYTAGTNSGAGTIAETITLTDTSNCVIDTATASVLGTPTTTTTTSPLKPRTTSIPATTTISDDSTTSTTSQSSTTTPSGSSTTTIDNDVCEESGYYGDGNCDSWCPNPDPDCGPITTTAKSSTTTTSVDDCLISFALDGNNAQLDLMRGFRDNVLSQTPSGQELIKLYYQWSPLLVQLMENDATFKGWVKKQIEGVLPLVKGTMQQNIH